MRATTDKGAILTPDGEIICELCKENKGTITVTQDYYYCESMPMIFSARENLNECGKLRKKWPWKVETVPGWDAVCLCRTESFANQIATLLTAEDEKERQQSRYMPGPRSADFTCLKDTSVLQTEPRLNIGKSIKVQILGHEWPMYITEHKPMDEDGVTRIAAVATGEPVQNEAAKPEED